MREVGSGLGFVVLRDFYGTTQIVLETEEMVKTAKAINMNSTIRYNLAGQKVNATYKGVVIVDGNKIVVK